jgi:hypothetical protein
MNYFLDTEFTRLPWEKGSNLISVGIVSEDGREYYACLDNFESEGFSDVVRDRIIPLLPDKSERKSPDIVKREILDFIKEKPAAFWSVFPDAEWLISLGVEKDKIQDILGTFGDYDLQLIQRLLGNDYPSDWPKRGSNLNSIIEEVSKKGPLPENKNQHNALSDAIQAKEIWLIAQK